MESWQQIFDEAKGVGKDLSDFLLEARESGQLEVAKTMLNGVLLDNEVPVKLVLLKDPDEV